MKLDCNHLVPIIHITKHTNHPVPWMTVIPREDFVCAGNEGVLDDDCIQSIDLRASILDFIMAAPDVNTN